MVRQDKESEEDVLIDILKSLVEECKAVYKVTSSHGTNEIQGGSIARVKNEGDILETLRCQLPPKELNLGSFILSCTIGNLNLYAMVDLGASVNIMPGSIFEHLKLTDLKETDMTIVMVDMTEKTLLGITENILVKIDKFLFSCDFIIADTIGEPYETIILGRSFLATIHAQIDVFKGNISLVIGEDRGLFDMDGNVCQSSIPVEKVYVTNSIPNKEPFNPLEIGEDLFSYESPSYLQFEQLDTMLSTERAKMESSNNGCVFGTMKDKALGETETDIRQKDEKSSKNGQNRARNGKA
ncbi:phospholipase-like protein [Tanacetum coccineum]